VLLHVIVHRVLILFGFLANSTDKEPFGILLIYVGHTGLVGGGGFNFCKRRGSGERSETALRCDCKPNGCPCEATVSSVARASEARQPYAATVSRTAKPSEARQPCEPLRIPTSLGILRIFRVPPRAPPLQNRRTSQRNETRRNEPLHHIHHALRRSTTTTSERHLLLPSF
jgi:hypothetical protein